MRKLIIMNNFYMHRNIYDDENLDYYDFILYDYIRENICVKIRNRIIDLRNNNICKEICFGIRKKVDRYEQ